MLICNLWEHALFIIFPEMSEQSHTVYLKQSGSYLHFLNTGSQNLYLTMLVLIKKLFIELAYVTNRIYQQTNSLITFLNIQPQPVLASSKILRSGPTAQCREHFNDTPYCSFHIDIVFKVKYQSCTPLGKEEKRGTFIFSLRLNQSNFAPP